MNVPVEALAPATTSTVPAHSLDLGVIGNAAAAALVDRTGSILMISTRKASPGSAPATKTGPFIGFGPRANSRPRASTPAASKVSVTKVSPLEIDSAGDIAVRTFGQACCSRRCVRTITQN